MKTKQQTTDTEQLTATQLKGKAIAGSALPGEDTSLILLFALSDPSNLFEQWTHTLPGKESTRRVKAAMGGKFFRWVEKRGFRVEEITEKMVEAFLQEEGITKEQRYRYVRLIELYYAFLISLGLSVPNPGQQAAVTMIRGANDKTRFFDEDELARIEAGVRDVLCKERSVSADRKDRTENWPYRRDVAIVGIALGGGLRLIELRELTVNCTYGPEGLDIDGHGGVLAHRAAWQSVGLFALETWLAERRTMSVPGNALFPPELASRRPGMTLPAKLDETTLYRRVRRILNDFGITGPRVAPQTLRNTYAAMAIDAGWSDAMILSYMGLHDEVTVPRLRNNLTDFRTRTRATKPQIN